VTGGNVYGLPFVLDNTPWWLEDSRRGTGNGLGRCNPFGYEDSTMGVFGGTADPAHEQHAWQCQNWADGRYRMSCQNGHAGQIRLCYAHVYQIRRRMSGVCPACAKPPRARELEDSMNAVMGQFRTRPRREWSQLAGHLEDLQREMNELIERGVIRTGAPLQLTEVS
jgi:hypothetical protein